eukprot:SAG11_NODE_13950_length_631_cov_2.009398_1_plen_124_part_01
MGDDVVAKLRESVTFVTEKAKDLYEKETYRGEIGENYLTLEDFKRCPSEPKRMVIIGCTGAGKSTLLNVMGGWRYVQSKKDYEWSWENNSEGKEPLFKASHGVNAVTQDTSFANLNWFGDREKV